MTTSRNIMNVSSRVLAALNAKLPPEPADVKILRHYLGHTGPSNLDELACEVIQKALLERAKARDTVKAGTDGIS